MYQCWETGQWSVGEVVIYEFFVTSSILEEGHFAIDLLVKAHFYSSVTENSIVTSRSIKWDV